MSRSTDSISASRARSPLCRAGPPQPAAPSCSPFTNSATPSGCATALFSCHRGACAARAPSIDCVRRQNCPPRASRRSSLRSPETSTHPRAPLRPLLGKELWEIVSGRALWIMLLLLCPLVGYSFVQAVSLYGEASTGAQDSPVLARSLSPFDGILVPSFGAFYVGVTLLFPFVAIRALAQEKESGALRLLVQLPYPPPVLIGGKLAAVAAAWALCSIPALSTLVAWRLLGGHLAPAETLTLLLGHLLYGLLVGAIALAAAAVTESAATAAIVALAVTIGSWVLDFTLAGRPGLPSWVALASLTQTLHGFEQGVLSAGLVLGILAAILGFAALAAVWLPPGVVLR